MPIPGGAPDVHRFAKGDTAQMMQKQKMINSYQMAEREAAAESGDAHMLVATLLDELLRRMNRYAESAETKSGPAQKEHFARSLTILHSLQDCLDFENGGQGETQSGPRRPTGGQMRRKGSQGVPWRR